MTASAVQRRSAAASTEGRSSKWHALTAGWLGETFDAMDASIYFIALVPALSELLRTKSDVEIGWIGSVILATFMIGWSIGGIAFGMLADRIGRTRTMITTILIYAVFTGLCATSHSWQEMAVYRFFVGCGIGGEICLGAVLVAEFWHGRSRLWATALLESSFNIGILMTAMFNLMLGHYSWRWLFVVGLLPAFVTLYIRARLGESESFKSVDSHRRRLRQRDAENLSEADRRFLRSPLLELFAPEIRSRIIITATLCTCAIVGYWACVSWIPAWVNQLTGSLAVEERSTANTYLSIGGLVGSFLVPLFFSWFGRRGTLKFSFGSCLVATLAMFLTVGSYGPVLLAYVAFIGAVASMQFVALCIYIPEAFATRMLATASGFSFSAGRVFAAIVALCGGQLIALYGGSYALASATLSLVYGIGFLAAFFLPDTSGEVAGLDIPADHSARTTGSHRQDVKAYPRPTALLK